MPTDKITLLVVVLLGAGLYLFRREIMAAIDDLNAKLDSLQTSFTEIGSDIEALKELVEQGQNPDGTLNADQVQAVLARLTTLDESAKALASAFTPDTPPAPPV